MEKISTIIVLVILANLVILAIRKIVQDQKKGCSMNCVGCQGSCSAFHYTKQAIKQHNAKKR